jgi:hypothetical protein
MSAMSPFNAPSGTIYRCHQWNRRHNNRLDRKEWWIVDKQMPLASCAPGSASNASLNIAMSSLAIKWRLIRT